MRSLTWVLTGQILPTLAKLSKLEKLNLRQNAFGGKIPEEIGDLRRLNKLDLCHNQFTGPLTKELGQLTELIELRLHCNQFSGEIHFTLALLTARGSPAWMVANWRCLMFVTPGTLPAEALGALTKLMYLRLHNNAFEGNVTISFSSCTVY